MIPITWQPRRRVVVDDLSEHVDQNLETDAQDNQCVRYNRKPPPQPLSRLWRLIKTIIKVPFVLLKLRLLSFFVGAGVSKVPPLSIPFLLFIDFCLDKRNWLNLTVSDPDFASDYPNVNNYCLTQTNKKSVKKFWLILHLQAEVEG